MTNMLIKYLRRLTSIFQSSKPHQAFSDSPPAIDKHQGLGSKQVNNKRCYYCDGLGFVDYCNKMGEFESSGIQRIGSAYSLLFDRCPLCKGAGVIEGKEQNTGWD